MGIAFGSAGPTLAPEPMGIASLCPSYAGPESMGIASLCPSYMWTIVHSAHRTIPRAALCDNAAPAARCRAVRRSLVPCRNAEPVWRRVGGVRPAAVPDAAWSWITEPASLTRRVQEGCPGVFDLRLLRQDWGEALPSERRLLRADRQDLELIREVELLCDGTPRVFARTVMPARSLIGRTRELTRLGTRPLGAVLFADPTTRRGTVEFARLSPAHALFAVAMTHAAGERPAELWGRRTVYRYGGRPLLVNEIFLAVLYR